MSEKYYLLNNKINHLLIMMISCFLLKMEIVFDFKIKMNML
ncbi:hypothetical protein BN1182_AB_00170 [Pantoea ananatis]|nr:hypothetical protein BN1182_AB_00170 [Pantoea ananatis]